MNFYKHLLSQSIPTMDPEIIAKANMFHTIVALIASGRYQLNLSPSNKMRLDNLFNEALAQLMTRNYIGYRNIIISILHSVGDIHENTEYDYDFVVNEDGGYYTFTFDFTDIIFEVRPVSIPNNIIIELYQHFVTTDNQ